MPLYRSRPFLRGVLALMLTQSCVCARAMPSSSAWPVRSGTVALDVSAEEADAALRVVQAADSASRHQAWTRVVETRPYQRLHEREASLGRAFTDSAFRSWLLSDSVRAQAPMFAATLQSWRTADIAGAAQRAAAYLPPNTPIRASLYFMIKPRRNTFVFDVQKDPAIFVSIDPPLSAAEFQNEYAHELHHIGYSVACRDAVDTTRNAAMSTVRRWMGGFGEGLAMLAAAGDPHINPHTMSSAAVRARWDADYANVATDLSRLQTFFSAILDGAMTDSTATATGMSFFGPVQGPWYTVGYLMASSIEQAQGRPALLEVICDPIAMIQRYQSIARSRSLPLWSDAFLGRLGRGNVSH